jgi:Na+/glutamate symporter
MIQRLFRVAAWLALAFIAFTTISPLRYRLVVSDAHLEHFVAFALMGLAFARGYPNRLLLIVAVVIGSAFALETLQFLTPDRHGRLLDALFKAAGGVFGIVIGHFGPPLMREQVTRVRAAIRARRAG